MDIYKSSLSPKAFLSADSEYKREYLNEIRAEYEKYKAEPVSELSFSAFMRFSRDGNRTEYEEQYFDRRKRLRAFALMSWLGDDEALSGLEEIMWAVCNEFTWVLPAHLGNGIFNKTIDLFAAETAHSLAEIISLVGDKLSGEIKTRCIAEIKERVLNPFINREKIYNWEIMQNNWCAVCGGCIGMTAIYLTDNIKAVTNSLVEVMESYIASFADDGACLEGLYYWNYGMMYFTAFLDLYRERTGEDFCVDTEKVRKMADFPGKCIMGNGYTLSFSDASDRDRVYSGLCNRLSQMYGANKVSTDYYFNYADDDCGRLCKAVRDIAWYGENDGVKQDKTAILPKAEWAIIGNDKYKIAFKGGNNAEPHNHNDIGSFSVLKNGEMILCDLGSGEYTAEYFSDKRYDILCNSSKGHSVPIINNEGQCTGHKFKAAEFRADETQVSAEIGGAYDSDVRCIRKISYGEAVMLSDTFTGSCDVTERFITRRNVSELDGAVRIGNCILRADVPYEIKYEAHAEHNGEKSKITVIDFKFKVDGKKEFLLEIL